METNMRRLASLSVMCVAGLLAGGCVPKARLDSQKLETDSCYSALARENQLKKERARAVAELEKALQDLTAERKRLAEEKGSLEGSLSSLEQAVADRMKEINRLSAEKTQLEQERAELAKKSETYDDLVNGLQEEMKQKLIEVKRKGQRITVNVSDQILFDSGKADVKVGGQVALDKIARVLSKVADRRIDIEGHTDNLKITGELARTFPTNWELSAVRATNVVRSLEGKGVDPRRMAAVGKSEFRPVSTNATPGGRQGNRRIEIVLTPWDGDQ
jgi:chemotaxis protein MotB